MKSIKILSVLFLLSFFFVSCEEEQNSEWERHYGYANAEIIGSYSYSHISDAFDGLTENVYCHICDDAVITISADSENAIKFDMRSVEGALNVSLVGPAAMNESDLVSFTDGAYELLAYVKINASGQIRLHGHVKSNNPSLVNYYFDVIKN